MSDIVERLRGEEWDGEIPLNVVDMLEDAAAEIERLRAALRFWCNAYRRGQHEPLVVAYESTVAKFPALEERT